MNIDILTINGAFYMIQKQYKKIEKYESKHQAEAKDRRIEKFCYLSLEMWIDLILFTTLFRLFLRDKGLTLQHLEDYLEKIIS